MTLRIIGGHFRNRLIKSPKGIATRPTTAMLRKSVFDICQFHIENARFLDLFAGSGAMGLEALSRGAKEAVFVDNNRFAIKCIEENIQILNVAERATMMPMDAYKALKKITVPFDLIYIDPPYEKVSYDEILSLIDALNLLKSGGRLFVEEAAPPKLKPDQHIYQHFSYKDSRRFSISVLHQYCAKS